MSGGNEMEWRTCPGFPSYEVSEYGHMRRVLRARTASAGTVLKGNKARHGYTTYSLRRDNKRHTWFAHRLVALAFIGEPPPGKPHIAHQDGNPRNNHWSNLRWDDPAGNAADRREHGTNPNGSRHPAAKLTEPQVRLLRSRVAERAGEWGAKAALAREFGISPQALNDIINGNGWSHVRA